MKEIKISYNEDSGEISLNNNIIGYWNNESNSDCPEDLIWSRDIGSLVRSVAISAYKLGQENK